MKITSKMLTLFALLLALAVPSSAGAVPQGMWGDQPVTITQSAGSAFTTVDISSGVATDAIDTYGYRFLTFDLDYVNSSGTAVTMTCQESNASAGTYRDITGLVASAHTLTSDILTWSNAVSGNENWSWTISLLAYVYVKCTFTATGGGAGDTLTVTALLGE